MQSRPSIECNDLSKAYTKRATALSDLNLSISEGTSSPANLLRHGRDGNHWLVGPRRAALHGRLHGRIDCAGPVLDAQARFDLCVGADLSRPEAVTISADARSPTPGRDKSAPTPRAAVSHPYGFCG